MHAHTVDIHTTSVLHPKSYTKHISKTYKTHIAMIDKVKLWNKHVLLFQGKPIIMKYEQDQSELI